MRTRSCVFRFGGALGAFVLLLVLTPVAALAQYWLPGPAPTCEINHYTQAFMPYDRTRTEIGIGEPVDLDVYTYTDMDIYVDDCGFQYEVPDELGLAEWTVDGPGEVSPTRGAYTTYTAPMWAQDMNVTVSVVMHDTGSLGLDPPITRSVSFTVRVPNGITVAFRSDNSLGTLGPPNNSMGASSYFYSYILPDTVNFWMVAFHEVIPEQAFTWPDQTQYVRQAETVPYEVAELFDVSPNWVGDTVSTDLQNPGHLLVPNSNPPTYGDCQFDVLVHNEFCSVNGWLNFVDETHHRKFRGSDLKSQVVSGAEPGGWQGPYTDPP